MGLLLQLQQRIPDRWFLRRLLPSAIFVAAAIVAGTAGQSHWNDFGPARARLAGWLGGSTASASATAIVYLLLAAAAAFAVPVAAVGVGTLAAGAWPWWLAPLGDRIRDSRAARWSSHDNLEKAAVAALRDGHRWRAARLKARMTVSTPSEPETPTWTGDRLSAAAGEVRGCLDIDVRSAWPELLLRLPDNARTALADARDGYDAACEAIVWSLAYLILGLWWWPAAVAGLVIVLTSWQWLRNAAETLARTAEAAARVAANSPKSAPQRGSRGDT